MNAFRFAGILLLAGLTTTPVRGNEQLYERTLQSTVCILAGDSLGSGVLVDAEKRLIATNFHVVAGHPEVMVLFAARQGDKLVAERSFYVQRRQELGIRGQVSVADPKRDLALVVLDWLPDDAAAQELAPGSPLPGEAIHSVGNPESSDALWVYTSGTVRQVYDRRDMTQDGRTIEARVIETQSPVNPGDSGGPVLNGQGQDNIAALVAAETVDSAAVIGCWQGTTKQADGNIQPLLFELRADGAFVWDERSRTVRGTFAIVDGQVFLTIAGEKVRLGIIQSADEKQMVLNVGKKSLTFVRQQPSRKTPPATIRPAEQDPPLLDVAAAGLRSK